MRIRATGDKNAVLKSSAIRYFHDGMSANWQLSGEINFNLCCKPASFFFFGAACAARAGRGTNLLTRNGFVQSWTAWQLTLPKRITAWFAKTRLRKQTAKSLILPTPSLGVKLRSLVTVTLSPTPAISLMLNFLQTDFYNWLTFCFDRRSPAKVVRAFSIENDIILKCKTQW